MTTRTDILADHDTERALLGACLLSDMAVEDSARLIQPGDFGALRHQQIYAAILEQRPGRVDPITLAAQLGEDALPYLHELQNATPSIGNAGRYALTVANWKLRRDLLHASDQIATLAYIDGDAGQAADQARSLLQHLDLPARRGAPDPDVDTFVGSIDTSYDWLIPGFLEHRDRLLLTAYEGAGKSVLLTQIAVMAAAGIHPWTYERIEPRNVLLVDLENSPRMVSRRLRSLRSKVDSTRFDPQRLRVHTRPSGIDLTTRTDRRWLLDRCEANATELLVIGPAYRLSAGVADRGDVGGEDHIRSVTAALDEIRVRCNVTLLMETHAPHGGGEGRVRDLRPFGSSVWLRWPEFGIGIRRDGDSLTRYKLDHWRGPRDRRTWPTHLEKEAGKWPWTPRMPDGTF